jgi:GNAT superfamily N-acetyltransferase
VTFAVRPLTSDRWDDLEELFERRGPRGGSRLGPAHGCWCMYWRDRSLGHGEPKKRALEALARAGREPGLLAYADGAAAGWVSVAPREEFAHLLVSPQYRPRDEGGGPAVWSVVCFAVDPAHRGAGVPAALLAGALEHAFTQGASAVEGYPHATNRGDYMGHVDLYARAGFTVVRATSKRRIVRRAR